MNKNVGYKIQTGFESLPFNLTYNLEPVISPKPQLFLFSIVYCKPQFYHVQMRLIVRLKCDSGYTHFSVLG